MLTRYLGKYLTDFHQAYSINAINVSHTDPYRISPCCQRHYMERLVARQLVDYLRERNLLPELQSAYRAYHSTETAVLRVVSDIFEALDRGDWAALTLLDISAAFDTVDHKTINTSKTKELIICYSKKVNVNDINIKNCSLSKC